MAAGFAVADLAAIASLKRESERGRRGRASGLTSARPNRRPWRPSSLSRPSLVPSERAERVRERITVEYRKSKMHFPFCLSPFPSNLRTRMPVDSLGATLPYDVLLIIHSFLPSVYGDSVRLDQIAHFRFAAISSVHRDAAFANGAYQVRFDRLSGFLALLKASSKLATGMKRLDLWCMTGRFDSLNGDRISNPAWRDMAEILGLAKNLQFLEIALGVNVIAGFPEVKVWKDHIEVSKQLEKLTELREFCFLSGWNAFDYKVVEWVPRATLLLSVADPQHVGYCRSGRSSSDSVSSEQRSKRSTLATSLDSILYPPNDRCSPPFLVFTPSESPSRPLDPSPSSNASPSSPLSSISTSSRNRP